MLPIAENPLEHIPTLAPREDFVFLDALPVDRQAIGPPIYSDKSFIALNEPPYVNDPDITTTPTVVGSYNLRVDRDAAPHRWTDRVSHIIENIHSSQASVIGLQEVQPRYIQDLSSAFPTMKILGAWRDASQSEGCHIMYDTHKWRILESKTLAFGGTQPTPCVGISCGEGRTCFSQVGCAKHRRIMTHLTLESLTGDGTILDVLNTHMPLKADLQVACARQITRLADEILRERPQSTVIVTGDMNTHHHPLDAGTASKHFKDTGFKDPLDWRDPPTFGNMSLGPNLPTNIHRLDYILIKQVSEAKIKLLHGQVRNFLYNNNKYRPSDHELCLATLL